VSLRGAILARRQSTSFPRAKSSWSSTCRLAGRCQTSSRPTTAPTDPIPLVRCDAGAGSRELVIAPWGLSPYWAKDPKIGYSTFNARCEDVENKPAVRDAFKHGRCLIPLDNSYEWKKAWAEGEATVRQRAQGRRAKGNGWAMGDVADPPRRRLAVPRSSPVHRMR